MMYGLFHWFNYVRARLDDMALFHWLVQNQDCWICTPKKLLMWYSVTLILCQLHAPWNVLATDWMVGYQLSCSY